jgi:hypothetical protein
MEEKILKAIKTHFYNIDGTPKKSAKEIDNLTREHYMEFAKYLTDGKAKYYAVSDIWMNNDYGEREFTLEEVYQYWLKELKTT